MSALEELAIDRKHVVGAVALALNVRGGVIPQLRT